MARPPHPGPRPERRHFPFVEAAAARAAADAAADALASLGRTHEDGIDHLDDGVFSGRTADALRDRAREQLAAIDAHVDALRRQARAIEDDIHEAARQDRIRDALIQDWHRALQAWESWEPEPARGP